MKFLGRKRLRTCLSMLLIVTCLLASFSFYNIIANAETIIRTGTVEVSNSLSFRSGPGTEYDIIGYLKNGDSGQIIDQAEATTGKIWYKMTVNGKTGWASSSYVKVTEKVLQENKTFDQYLTLQGFPESYKAQLQALHAQYPNWVFEAQKTNLNWSDVIAAESALGKNLVSSSANTSWKSMQNGAYNWETGEWVEFDSGGWVAASREVIEHFMDPRNFLDSTNVFQFIKQSYNAKLMTSEQIAQKKSDLTNMVKGTYLAGTCPGTSRSYVDVIMEAAEKSGVCPFTLASMMIQEQGVDGGGRSISGTVSGYEGYYNYLNIGSYKTSTMSAVERGLWFAKGSGEGKTTYERPWNNATDSIIGGSIYYGEGYVKVGQDTLYLKKFNVQGSNLYGHQYMTNVQGAYSEGQHMAKAYDASARNAALVFKIPVYNNMPDTPCKKPTGNNNPNYMLSSLSVSGYQLTPTFSMHEEAYSLIVPNEVSSVTIAASTLAGTTTVTGTGAKSLNVGSNVLQIVTKAQNGTSKTYTITIVRQEVTTQQPSGNVPIPSVSATALTINGDSTITGFSVTMNVAAVKSKFTVQNGSVKLMSVGGTEKSDTSAVGTGDQVRVYDNAGTHKLTYHVVIYGDTNGDGKTNTSDYVQIRKQILGTLSLSSYNKQAADTNRNGKIDLSDYVQTRKQILGEYQIRQ